MKEKTQKLLEKVEKVMGVDADVMILSHDGGKCAAITHGSTENIAQTIFACMHQSDNSIGPVLYRIIKLNVINILNTPSLFAGDLIDAINNVLYNSNEAN